MKRTVVWKNEEARARLEGWYDRFLRKIGVPVQRHMVETAHGQNHVLVAGPESATTLVCLHAMRTGAPFLLSELGYLLERFRVIAPDIPGHSVRGAAVRLPTNDDSHARWLIDVVDAMNINRFRMFGVSWGGFVARQVAQTVPDRIEKLALLVPAGIVAGSHWKGLTRMAIPMMRYRMRRSESNLRRFLDPLLTTWDTDWTQFMGESLSDMVLDLRIPPLATDADLKRLSMPTLVLGGDRDISFPADKLIRRVSSVLPQAEVESIPDCNHCPPTTPEFRTWLGERVTRFLNG